MAPRDRAREVPPSKVHLVANRVVILGDGQMALAMADVLAAGGAETRLWAHSSADIEALARDRRSPRLPGFVLPESVQPIAADEAALAGADVIVNAIPAQFVRAVWQRLAKHVQPRVPVVSVSKGIENETLLRPTQTIEDVLRDKPEGARSMCALSGPTIGPELARRLPATMVAASPDQPLARRVQELFTSRWLRIYTHDDIIGVELAGATKNVIAIAAGIADGLAIGFNAKSALLARGLAEIARLGAAMGARLDTFFGVAGVGDLATTCFSPEGRNRTCGERLARGERLQQIVSSTASVIEGVATAKSVHRLARRLSVDMPITDAVHDILFEDLKPARAIEELMGRSAKAERIG
jgi:glycerol-3-phosphate dehydrogenase (NAD(P)+)